MKYVVLKASRSMVRYALGVIRGFCSVYAWNSPHPISIKVVSFTAQISKHTVALCPANRVELRIEPPEPFKCNQLAKWHRAMQRTGTGCCLKR